MFATKPENVFIDVSRSSIALRRLGRASSIIFSKPFIVPVSLAIKIFEINIFLSTSSVKPPIAFFTTRVASAVSTTPLAKSSAVLNSAFIAGISSSGLTPPILSRNIFASCSCCFNIARSRPALSSIPAVFVCLSSNLLICLIKRLVRVD